MDDFEVTEKDLSNAKMADTLEYVLNMSDILVNFYTLSELDTARLLKKAIDELKNHGLNWSEAAKLLGVTENTTKRWQRSKDLTENAKQKIAALCSLLSCSKNEEKSDYRVSDLVSLAISNVHGNESLDQDVTNYGIPRQSLSSVFGISGLMAAAWYLATNQTNTYLDTDTEQ